MRSIIFTPLIIIIMIAAIFSFIKFRAYWNAAVVEESSWNCFVCGACNRGSYERREISGNTLMRVVENGYKRTMEEFEEKKKECK